MRPVIKRWVKAIVPVMVALYAPFGWLLAGYPWSSYELHWMAMWPVLPGLLPGELVRRAMGFDDTGMQIVMGVVTLWVIVGLSWLGSRGTKMLVIAIVVALIFAGATSMAAYAAFRA